MKMDKKTVAMPYEAPVFTCVEVISEGVLCSSPGYGGGEDMEEGDEL